MQFSRTTGRLLPALVLAAAAAASARAAAPDKYLPSDSDFVAVINVRQLLDSPLVKKQDLEKLRSQMKSNEDVNKILQATGLDPLKDIDSVSLGVALGTGEPKVAFVVHGKFDLDKIHAAAAEAAKAKPDEFGVETKDGTKIYRMKGKGASEKPVYATFANGSTLVATQSADQTVAAAKGEGGKLSETLTTALDKIGGKESAYFAVGVNETMRKGLANNPNQQMAGLAPKLQYATGTLNLTKDFALTLRVQTTDADAAKEVSKFIRQFLPLVNMMAAGNQDAGPAVAEVLKKIEVKTDSNAAVVSLEIPEETLKELEKSSEKSSDKTPGKAPGKRKKKTQDSD